MACCRDSSGAGSAWFPSTGSILERASSAGGSGRKAFGWLLCLLGLLAQGSAAEATNAVAEGPAPPSRSLIVVEASRGTQRRVEGIVQTVRALLDSQFKGQLRSGDYLGLWTFNEDLYTSRFPLQQWTSEKHPALAQQAQTLLLGQAYEKSANLEIVLPQLLRVMQQSEVVTVVLLSAGEGKMRGTPVDSVINEAWKEWRGRQQKAQMPVVTVLRSVNGQLTYWSVAPGPATPELPPLPGQLPVAQQKTAPAITVAKAVSNPPPLFAAVELKPKTLTNILARKMAEATTAARQSNAPPLFANVDVKPKSLTNAVALKRTGPTTTPQRTNAFVETAGPPPATSRPGAEASPVPPMVSGASTPSQLANTTPKTNVFPVSASPPTTVGRQSSPAVQSASSIAATKDRQTALRISDGPKATPGVAAPAAAPEVSSRSKVPVETPAPIQRTPAEPKPRSDTAAQDMPAVNDRAVPVSTVPGINAPAQASPAAPPPTAPITAPNSLTEAGKTSPSPSSPSATTPQATGASSRGGSDEAAVSPPQPASPSKPPLQIPSSQARGFLAENAIWLALLAIMTCGAGYFMWLWITTFFRRSSGDEPQFQPLAFQPTEPEEIAQPSQSERGDKRPAETAGKP